MRGGKTGLVAIEVGDRGVEDVGRCIWAYWWARSRSRVYLGTDNWVMSWLEFHSSASECSASGAELVGCP